MSKTINYFSDLEAVECVVEKKGKLSYVSWIEAWAQLKRRYPTASYRVLLTPEGRFLWGEGLVRTEVTVCDVTHEMWLPVMDGRNNQIADPSTTDINKAVMRCLTKNLAMHGVAPYVYMGEDLPVVSDAPQAAPRPSNGAQVKPAAPSLTPAQQRAAGALRAAGLDRQGMIDVLGRYGAEGLTELTDAEAERLASDLAGDA